MIIAPSLLAGNYGRLAAEAKRVERSGADWLHVDIMDGHFVPNLSFGPELVRVVHQEVRLFLDVHLMCSRPEILLEPFAKAGASQITIHVELDDRVWPLIWKIKSLRKKVGLAVNPPTSIAQVRPYLKELDNLLVMTVNPGFGGQSFIHETLPKIQQAEVWRREQSCRYRIAVDGGIGFATFGECARAGADTFISGSTLFAQRSMSAAVTRMRKAAKKTARPISP